jgi:UDP-glucuronate decarboxylase
MATGDDLAGPVNLGNPHEVPVIELADRVIAATGSSAPIVFKPLPPDDPSRRRPDIDRARRLLRWEPRHPLDEGLAVTVDYFRSALAEDEPAARRFAAAQGIGGDEASADRTAALPPPRMASAGLGRVGR